MACSRVVAEAVAERYLAGGLTEDEQSAFERHYFECDRCFDELRMLQARTEPRATTASSVDTTRARQTPWLAVAASVLVASGVGLWLWIRPASPNTAAPDGSSTAATQVATPAPVRRPPPFLAELARFDPPVYRAPALRAPEGEARIRYREAMQYYSQRDYAHAIVLLRASTSLDPASADAAFFHGISLLLADRTDEGITELRRTIAIGNSPYLEESQYYLAKGLLKRADTNAAGDALRAMIALDGKRQREGRTLLSEVERAFAGGGTPAGLVTVPDLIGATEAKALELLDKANLRSGVVSTAVANATPGTVIQQARPPGAQVRAGSTVDFVIAVQRRQSN